MKIPNLNNLLLIGIGIFAGFLRFWHISSVPPSLYWDEVSQAYNACSILETGRDEHGELFPLARFKAFGDYKAPVLIYLMVPSMAVFGKTDFAVRFPSAFLGTLTVVITYLLVSELMRNTKKKAKYLPLISAGLLAISPWHIQLSRGAFEGNVAQFFMVFGIYLFFISIRKNAWWLIGSFISSVIAMYAFNAHRVTVPLVMGMLCVLYVKKMFAAKKQILISATAALILLIPLIQFLTSPEGRLRFNEVNIFTDLSVIQESNRLQELDNYSLLSRIVHNRRVLYAQSYLTHYFDFFNPRYLFVSGDGNPRFSSQETGQLYIVMLPFILLGFYALARRKEKSSLAVILWFLLSPVVAATARETPHALRSITYIPTYEIIASLGVMYSYYLVKQYFYRLRLVYVVLVLAAFLGSTGFFSYTYFVHFPRQYAREWQYGYKETVEYIMARRYQYDQIYFTDAYGRPSIYTAYYGTISPEEYRQSAKVVRDYYGFYTVSSIGNIFFKEGNPDQQPADKKILYVVPPEKKSAMMKVLHTVYFPDGDPAFIIAEKT
jgi:4-amino-4-deoxy-L-arabinose transferase-like glycosyltransferase